MSHSEYRITLGPRRPDDPDRAVAQPLSLALSTLGFVPNMYANMANLPALLESYVSGYGAFRANSGLTRTEQEVVFLSISERNGCEYCVAAHSALAAMAQVPDDITGALRSGGELPDSRLQALSRFTRVMVDSRGLPSEDDVRTFLGAGYGEQDILAIILAIGVKTLSNMSNHLFHTEVDAAFSGHVWSTAA